jgi:hypothetical protein
MSFYHVNMIGVFFSAVAAFVIGMAWYSPLLFAKPWMKFMGFSPESCKEGKAGMFPAMVTAFVLSGLMVFVFGYFIVRTHSHSLPDAARKAVLLWGGFVVPVMAGSVIWEKKPFGLFLINAGHYLAVLLAAGFILVLTN